MSMTGATPAQRHLGGLFHSLLKLGQNSPGSLAFRGFLQLFYNAASPAIGGFCLWEITSKERIPDFFDDVVRTTPDR
jgi:hypothetical protein|tara:strand:- start:353 stop:583 length:231 start_codon:yes stop_codon:yes gene_type:complete